MTFAHLTIATRDADATARFFEATLGWRRIHLPTNVEIKAAWVEVAPGQQIHILEIPGFEPSPFEAEFGRHYAFFYPGRIRCAEAAPRRARRDRHPPDPPDPIRAILLPRSQRVLL